VCGIRALRLETLVADPDTEGVLRSYAFGFFSASLAVLLVAAIWIGTQPKQEAGLLWGDKVYTSKQEFNGYLKSKGLSYKTWVARNPGAAPWEPEEFAVGAITVRASPRTAQLVLAAAGWLLATAGALLLLRGGRPDMPGFAKGSVALFSAVLAGLLIAGIWFTTQSTQEPGLKWGGVVYTSKQEFNAYLKSKGLSYKTWVARNPGAAPWEPAAVGISGKAPEVTKVREVAKAPDSSEVHAGWMGRPLLASIVLMLAAGCSLLLLRGRRPVMTRYPRGSIAYDSVGARAIRIGKGSAGMPTAAAASVRRLGLLASGATSRLRLSVPLYGKRLIAATRAIPRGLSGFMREQNISGGDAAYGLLAALSAVVFALIVVLVLSP
jgi:hypothetical protein